MSAPDTPKNVLGTPLQICSTDPITGWFRDGYCNTDNTDFGKFSTLHYYHNLQIFHNNNNSNTPGRHTVAAVVTDEFLEFTKSIGNDLSTPRPPIFSGLRSGCKWCLCVDRWKEAFMARSNLGDNVVPKVILESTHNKTLESVSLRDLEAFSYRQYDNYPSNIQNTNDNNSNNRLRFDVGR